MNVRDFLFNFVDKNTKICVKKYVNESILFYGKAEALDHIEVLNKAVQCVDFDIKAGCLNIRVRSVQTGVTYHLPEEIDFVY